MIIIECRCRRIDGVPRHPPQFGKKSVGAPDRVFGPNLGIQAKRRILETHPNLSEAMRGTGIAYKLTLRFERFRPRTKCSSHFDWRKLVRCALKDDRRRQASVEMLDWREFGSTLGDLISLQKRHSGA